MNGPALVRTVTHFPMLTDDESELVYTAADGAGADAVVGLRIPSGQGVAGWVAASGQPVAIGDLARDPRFAGEVAEQTGYVPRAMLVVPVRSPDRLLGVLGATAMLCGFSILKFIRYIKEELLIVLGTSSSETVLPRMLAKLENLGCEKSIVGLVIPTGYSFNLDGTCIYLTMAAMFLAQATNTDLSLGQQLGLIGILLLTSKGAAGVTGSGFIVLAATLASVGTVPVASIALILGVDRFMSEARALTNLVGNGVATVVVAKWEGALDEGRLNRVLNGETEAEADDPEGVLVAGAAR